MQDAGAAKTTGEMRSGETLSAFSAERARSCTERDSVEVALIV